MSGRPQASAVSWRGVSGEQSAVFRLTTGNGAMQAGFAVHPEALYEISEPPVQTGQAERHIANGLESGVERASAAPVPSNRSPAKRVRFEQEEGGSGCGAFTALTETGKAEWSELLLTPLRKAAANQVLAQDL